MVVKKTVSKMFAFLFVITAALVVLNFVGIPSFILAPFMAIQTITFLILSPIMIGVVIIIILIFIILFK